MVRSRRGGFTLIELLVGLTVASLALLAGFTALGTVADLGDRAEDAAREAVAGATQRGLLVEWLAGARMRASTGETFEGVQQEERGRVVDLLLFPTTARTPLGGTSAVIGLYIDQDEETPERGLVAELSGMTFGTELRRMELVPEAAMMRIRYLAEGRGLDEWEDSWTARNRLPRLIEITLFPAPGDSLPLLLRHPLRVAPGGTL
jgi:prepilin-type N-terminal cleavage/methylation domain-containing protein